MNDGYGPGMDTDTEMETVVDTGLWGRTLTFKQQRKQAPSVTDMIKPGPRTLQHTQSRPLTWKRQRNCHRHEFGQWHVHRNGQGCGHSHGQRHEHRIDTFSAEGMYTGIATTTAMETDMDNHFQGLGVGRVRPPSSSGQLPLENCQNRAGSIWIN